MCVSLCGIETQLIICSRNELVACTLLRCGAPRHKYHSIPMRTDRQTAEPKTKMESFRDRVPKISIEQSVNVRLMK